MFQPKFPKLFGIQTSTKYCRIVFFCIDELAFSQTYLLYWTLVKFPQSFKSPFKYFCPYLTKINLFAYTVTLGHMSQWRYLYIVDNILWGITFADFLSTLWKNLRFQLNYLALTLALETSRSSGGDFLSKILFLEGWMFRRRFCAWIFDPCTGYISIGGDFVIEYFSWWKFFFLTGWILWVLVWTIFIMKIIVGFREVVQEICPWSGIFL